MVVARELGTQANIIAPSEAIQVATLPPEAQRDGLHSPLDALAQPESAVESPGRVVSQTLSKFPLESFPVVKRAPFVTAEDVRAVPNLCHKFDYASYEMIRDGTLERLCRVLIQSRKVEGRTEGEAKKNALAWLNEKSLKYKDEPQFMSRGDAQRKGATYARTEAKKLAGDIKDDPDTRLLIVAGDVLHVIAHMSDGHYVYDPTKYRPQLELRHGEDGQLSISRKHKDDKSSWSPIRNLWSIPGLGHLNHVSMFGHIGLPFTHAILDARNELWKLRAQRREGKISAATYMYEVVPRAYGMLHQFAAIFPPDVLYRLVESDSTAARYVLVETMLAAANKFLEARDKPRKLIRQEIRALSIPHLGKPRIDGLVLQNGKPLGDDAFHWLKDSQFSSAGDLISQFRQRHGSGEQWPVERKTRIESPQALLGVDLLSGRNKIGHANGELITSKDVRQLEDYLSMVPADTYYVTREGSPWVASSRGIIEVLTADAKPYEEVVVLAPERQQEIFREWYDLTRNPMVRRATDARSRINYLVACTRAAVKGQEIKHRNLTIEYDVDPLEVIIGKPIYLNPELQIGERVGKNKKTGEPYYMFNYDDIAKAIEAGKIKARGFARGKKSFFMRCVNKDHVSRKNLTMHVHMVHGVKCFSCGVKGFLDSNSIPKEFADQVRTVREINRETRNTNEIIMSEEHLAFMEDLQRAFQKYFKGSRGEQYLRDRGIDPDEAFRLGAGYGDARVIKDMANSPNKWTIEQMAKYGLLGIREDDVFVRFGGQEETRVSEDTRVIDAPAGKMDILSVLVEAGLARDDDDAIKLISKRAIEINGKTVEGNCVLIGRNLTLRKKSRYFKWNGRVTFPLIWGGRITSFYGRATWKFHDDAAKNKGAHRKAKIEREQIEVGGKMRWTNPPQGAFNAEVLQKKNLKYVVITEGVADALSLMAMGIENVVAIIGTYNDVSIEEIAAIGVPVYVALDADIPGSLNAYKVYDKLKQAGLKQPIYNFTHTMFANFAEHTRVRFRGGKEPRLVTQEDLILYRNLRHLYLREIEKIEDSGFPKDFNEMWLYDKVTALEVVRELFPLFTPEHQITDEMYARIFEDSKVAHDVLVKHGYSEHIVANGNGLVYKAG